MAGTWIINYNNSIYIYICIFLLINSALGNGGRTERYEWTQTLQELSVVVKVPEGSRSRDVVCDISKSKLRVGIKGQPLLVDVSYYLIVCVCVFSVVLLSKVYF